MDSAAKSTYDKISSILDMDMGNDMPRFELNATTPAPTNNNVPGSLGFTADRDHSTFLDLVFWDGSRDRLTDISVRTRISRVKQMIYTDCIPKHPRYTDLIQQKITPDKIRLEYNGKGLHDKDTLIASDLLDGKEILVIFDGLQSSSSQQQGRMIAFDETQPSSSVLDDSRDRDLQIFREQLEQQSEQNQFPSQNQQQQQQPFASSSFLFTNLHNSLDIAGAMAHEIESNRQTEELEFHSTLEVLLDSRGHMEGLGKVGYRCEDKEQQACISVNYWELLDRSLRDSESRSQQFALEMKEYQDNETLRSAKSASDEEQKEARAERDFWSLLAIFTKCDLLTDINDDECSVALETALKELPASASIREIEEAALANDQRMRKGNVLQNWIETAAQDRIEHIPEDILLSMTKQDDDEGGKINFGSWDNSLYARQGNKESSISSIHPDAQLTQDGFLISLENEDAVAQEALLKYIWTLLRCGLINDAQQAAYEYGVYWLAASLAGVAKYYYVESDKALGDAMDFQDDDFAEDDGRYTVHKRCGNIRRPIWMRSCWSYSQKLSNNENNWKSISVKTKNGKVTTEVKTPVYEMSIFAALSNNIEVLVKQSQLVNHWTDRLWVVLKAVNERDISRVLMNHREWTGKLEHSKLYPDCQPEIIKASDELLKLVPPKINDDLSMATCSDILMLTEPLPSGLDLKAESLILKLQMAVIKGLKGVQEYIQKDMVIVLDRVVSNYRKGARDLRTLFPGCARVLRVYAHFVLWLRLSAPPQYTDKIDLAQLQALTDEVYYKAIEAYIAHLICSKQRALVAAYASFLSQHRKVHQYVKLLKSIPPVDDQQQPSGESVDAMPAPEAIEAIVIAKRYFSAEEVTEIARAAVQGDSYDEEMEEEEVMDQDFTKSQRRVSFGADEEISPEKGVGVGVGETPMTVDNRGMARGKGSAHTPFERTRKLSFSGDRATADSPGSVEKQRSLISLKWLFIDPAHRIEAIRESNRFIINLLSEKGGKKLEQVSQILNQYIPLDSEDLGHQILEATHESLEESNRDIQGKAQNNMNTEEEEANLQEEYQDFKLMREQWYNDLYLKSLWAAYLETSADIQKAKETLGDYKKELQNSVGSQAIITASLSRHRGVIEASTDTAMDSIEQCIRQGPTGGMMEIWHRLEAAAVTSMDNNVERIPQSISNEKEASYLDLEDADKLRERVTGLEKYIVALFDAPTSLKDTAALHIDDTHVKERHTDALKILKGNPDSLLVKLEAMILECETASEETASLRAAIKVVIEKCTASLEGIEKSRQVCRQMLSSLLRTYLDLATLSGDALGQLSLENSPFSHQKYAKGVEVANLIADENPALQLYGVLPVSEVEYLLLRVAQCAHRAVEIKGFFDVGNSN